MTSTGDPNMDTILGWSRECPGPVSLPAELENDHEKQIQIILAIESCIGVEFDEDVKSFQMQYGRLPEPSERRRIHPPFFSYDTARKSKFVNCVIQKTRNLLAVDDDARVNVAFRLWPGCLMTSKAISAGTQTGPNTPESRRRQFENFINPNSTDAVFKAGQKISPFFKHRLGQGNDVFFEGIPAGSAIFEIRESFENTSKGVGSG
jgi:hypothetical protein